jgi:Protein of unknown function (DUF1571)
MHGRTVVPVVLVLALSLALVGCFTLDTTLPAMRPSVAIAAATPPTPAADPSPPVPDLRIADVGQVKAEDIPLVPVPLPGSSAPSRSEAPAAAAAPVAPSRPTATPATPTAASTPSGPSTPRQLIDRAAAQYAGVDSYIARLTRQEVVNGTLKQREVLTFKFRKEPWSVYFKWLNKESAGREAVYVRGQFENKIHTLLAAGDIPFMPAGRRMSLAPDSSLIRSASRQPITEAGMGASIDRLTNLLRAQEAGDRRAGVLVAIGAVNRPEFPMPLQGLEHTIPAGAETNLPRGGKRFYGFDPETNLPVFIVTQDDKGQEVEYYSYDRLQFPVHLDNDDFNPDKLWAPQRPTATAAAGR